VLSSGKGGLFIFIQIIMLNTNLNKGSGEPHNPHELEKLHRARKEFEKCAKSDFTYCSNLTYNVTLSTLERQEHGFLFTSKIVKT